MSRYTQQQLDDLRGHIARGAREVSINGERVVFRDLAEMRGLAAEMERELGLAQAPANGRATGVHYPAVSRGM